jgi:hypothetical protein
MQEYHDSFANNLFPSDPDLTGFFSSFTVQSIREESNKERKRIGRPGPTLPLPPHDNIKTEAAEEKILEQDVSASALN